MEQNMKKKSHLKPLCWLILCFLIVNLATISIVSAFDFDNIKSDLIKDETTSPYGKIEIRNSILGIPFLQLGKVAEIELLENTDYCLINCYAEGKITLYENQNLMDSLRFEELDNGKRNYKSVNNNIYINISSELVEVDDYEEDCIGVPIQEVYHSKNDTTTGGGFKEVCTPRKTGSHFETRTIWDEYNGQELLPGNYKWRIEGRKDAHSTVDWLATFASTEIDDWALWTTGNDELISYYTLNQSTGSVGNDSIENYDIDFTYFTVPLENWAIGGGKISNSAILNGSNYGTITGMDNFLAGTKHLSYAFWLKINNTSPLINSIIADASAPATYSNMVAIHVNRLRYVSNDGICERGLGLIANGTTFPNDVWLHFAIVINQSGVYTFVNGSLFERLDCVATDVFKSGDEEITIGTWKHSGAGYNYLLNGSLDEFGIWNRSLTSDEVSDLWNSGSGLSYGTAGGESLISTLVSPIDNFAISGEGENFTAYYNATQMSLVNATYTIWNSSGGIFNETTIDIYNIGETQPTNNKTTQLITNFTLGTYEWNVYVCGNTTTTINCSWATNNFTLNIGADVTDEYYPNLTIETNNESFVMNISLVPGAILFDATLYYNGTGYNAQFEDLGGDNYNVETSIAIPVVTTSGNNHSWFWSLDYNIVAGGTLNQNFSLRTTTVNKLQVVNITSNACPAGFNASFNFTSIIESNLSKINFTTVDYNLQYGSEGNSSALVSSGTFNNIPNFHICINSSYSYYVGYGEIQYEVSGYSSRRFYIFESERLTNITISNNLYSLETASSTAFQITATDTGLSPYDGYYVALLRWYPALDEYRIVDMGKTDSSGQTVVHVKVDDVDYRLGLYEPDGTLVRLLDPIRMVCQTTPCVYSLIVDLDEIDLTTFLNIESSLTFNKTTSIFTYIFNDASQDTTVMNLTVWRDSPDSGSTIICSTSTASFTGVLVCDVSAFSGQLRAEVYREASPSILIAQRLESIRDSLIDVAGGKTMVLFIGLILVMVMALMGIVSPPLVIILSLVGLIPLVILGGINYAVFMILGAIAGIVLHFLRRVIGR